MKQHLGMIILVGGTISLAIYCMVADWRARKLILRADEGIKDAVGDGAWIKLPPIVDIPPSERLRRLREIEPRGV